MSESKIPTFDQLVNSELAKYDSVIPKIEELKERYLVLKINSIDDKDGYQQVKDAIRFMVSKRGEIEEKRKELKADSIAFGKAVDARAREITSMITPIEEYLKEQKSKIDDELEAIRLREEEEKQSKIRKRHETLISIGMKLIGNEYIWESVSIGPPELKIGKMSLAVVNLETLDDNDFLEFVEEARMLHIADQENLEKERAIKLQQERILQEERQKLEVEQKKLLEEQQRIKAENDKMRKEMEDMIALRTENRITQLTNMGLVLSLDAICYRRGMQTIPLIPISNIRGATLEDWPEIFNSVTKLVNTYKKEDEKLREVENEKIRKEAIEAEEAKRKQKEEEAERVEQERLAGLSDKQKVADYCRRLLEVPTPDVKTLKWKKELKIITTTIVEHLN